MGIFDAVNWDWMTPLIFNGIAILIMFVVLYRVMRFTTELNKKEKERDNDNDR